MAEKSNSIPFQSVIDALVETGKPFPSSFLTRFSDIQSSDLALLKSAWPEVKPKRRLNLVEDLIKFNEKTTIVCFDDVAMFFSPMMMPRPNSQHPFTARIGRSASGSTLYLSA